MKALEKIDKFYLAMSIMLVVLTGIIVYSLKTIFTSINLATEIEDSNKNGSLKMDREKMDKAIIAIEQRPVVRLNPR